MKLTKTKNRENNIWTFEGTFHEKQVPKEAGFRWNPDEKCWWTDDINKAALLHAIADDAAKSELEAVRGHQEASFEASRATDATLDIPAPEGLSYMPFQRAGVAYALGRDNTLIGDEMGLGKTIQALGVINADKNITSTLVICPASLKVNWYREGVKWLADVYDQRDFCIIDSKSGWIGRPFTIINYDILKRFHNELRAKTWSLMIVDEAHYLKNERTQRAKHVFGYTSRDKKEVIEAIPATRKLFLTGTPIVNRPKELWPLVHNLDPVGWPNFFKYAIRYCGAHKGQWGWDFSGATNLDELQEKLRSTVMVRRLKKDVLKELPAKVRQVIEVQAPGTKDQLAKEMAEYEDRLKRLVKLRAAVELAKASDDTDEYRDAMRNLKAEQAIGFDELSRKRKEVALLKVQTVCDHIRDCLDSVPKLVVFCHHHDVIDRICQDLVSAGVGWARLDGRMNMAERQRSVDDFQNNGSLVRVFVGQIQAAGVGLTLTAASHVVFAELDWVPGNISQAEDRCHRVGQTDSVLVQHIVLEGSLDAKMARTVVNKQEVIEKGLDNEIAEERFSVDTLIESVQAPAPATEGTMTLDEIVLTLTPTRIKAIHEALQMLSGVCDGARQLDGQGFSAIDVEIGHSLANWPKITPKQAALGMRLVKKYRRQLGDEQVRLCEGKQPEQTM